MHTTEKEVPQTTDGEMDRSMQIVVELFSYDTPVNLRNHLKTMLHLCLVPPDATFEMNLEMKHQLLHCYNALDELLEKVDDIDW